MSHQFPGAPVEAMGHRTEMQSTLLSPPGSPWAVEDLALVSDHHAESALPNEQEQGSHFHDAFFGLGDISSDNQLTHVPDNIHWPTFAETYRPSPEQGANVLSRRPTLTPTHNARGYEDMQHLAEANELFERAVETGNEGQLSAGILGTFIHSPVPLNSVLEEAHVSVHNSTPRVHIEQATAHHGFGSFNARDHEQSDDLPSYGNPSTQHHDVSVESVDVTSSNVEYYADTDHADTTVGTSDAHHDVEMIESHTSESFDAGTPVAQADIQDEDPAKKTTPPLSKQSDGGTRKNDNEGQNGVRTEPFHSDLSGEKDETTEEHQSSQMNSGDSTPPEANIEDLIDPALAAPSQNVAPNSELANMSSDPAHNAENAYETPADSQEAQVANHSGGQGVTTSSTQGQSRQSNGSAVLDHPTNNYAHQPAPVQQSQHRSLSSTAGSNHVDQSQEHPARDISNEQQQIQTRPVGSERPAQDQAHQSQNASPVPAAASGGHRSSKPPQTLPKQASPDPPPDGRKRVSMVARLFPQLDEIPGPTSHDVMNPELSRLEIETQFASLKEAQDAMNARRGPPRDPNLHVSEGQKIFIASAFLRGMRNLEKIDDTEKTGKIWRRFMAERPLEVEVACWNVLELMIEFHRTTPLPKIPPPKQQKGGKKEPKEKGKEDPDEDEKGEKRPQDPTRSGALLSFPERAATIARIFHVSKSACRRMLDPKSQYVRQFVETPLSCLARARSNLIGNERKQEDIKRGRAARAQEEKAQAEAKNEAEAKSEAQPPAEELDEVEDALMAGDNSLDINELLEETVDTVLDQVTPGQPGPLSASAARSQPSYAPNGQYSQSYSMQGQNNAGQNQVMSNTGHNQGMNNNGQIPGMAYSGQQQGVLNTGHYNVMNNHEHIQGTAYPQHQAMPNSGRNPVINNNNGQIRDTAYPEHQAVPNTRRNPAINNNGQIRGTAYPGHQALPNTGQSHAMNNHRHAQGTAYSGQHGVSNTGPNHLMTNKGQIPGMIYPGQQGVPNTGYSNGMPGGSNTGQILRTTNTEQFSPTNSTGVQPSMNNMGSMYMGPASNTPRPYNSNSGYDQLGISSEFSATAVANSHELDNADFNASIWANCWDLETPPPQNRAQHYAQHAALLATYHQPTSTPTSMVVQNPFVSNMGANNGMPPNNTRSRKRSSTEAGASEAGGPTKKRR